MRSLATAAVLVVVLTACGATARPTADPVLTDRVAVFEPAGKPDEWGFAPAAIRVARGTTVTWTNPGVELHTATSDDPGRPFDVALPVGAQAAATFSNPGTFRYHCGVHPQMKGSVIVCDGACR